MTEQSGDMTAAFSSALEGASTTVAEASPASTPAPESPAPETTPAAATAQPEAPTQTTEQASTTAKETEKGHQARLPDGTFAPPTERWPTILENQRTKAAEAERARLLQEYQWAQGIAPSDRDIAADAIRAYRQQELARQQATDTMPDPDLQTADGTAVYSASQLQKWQEWNARQLTAKWTEQLQPLQQNVQQWQQLVQRAQDESVVTQAVERFKAAHPDFDTHKADLAATINADADLQRLAEQNPALALEVAYARVFQSKVLPAQQKASEQQVLANLQQRAVAGTVNPNAPAPASPRQFQPGAEGFAAALSHFAGSDAR